MKKKLMGSHNIQTFSKNYQWNNFVFPLKEIQFNDIFFEYIYKILKKFYIQISDNKNYTLMTYVTNGKEVLSLNSAFIFNKNTTLGLFKKIILKNAEKRIYEIYKWQKTDYLIFNLTKW